MVFRESNANKSSFTEQTQSPEARFFRAFDPFCFHDYSFLDLSACTLAGRFGAGQTFKNGFIAQHTASVARKQQSTSRADLAGPEKRPRTGVGE